jgi:hypothetical protein
MKSGAGLAGAQRTGKTTLARAYCEIHGVPFLEVSPDVIHAVYANMGLSPKETYDFKTRLEIQWRILERAVEKYKAMQCALFVADRTPLCFLAYTMADIGKDNVTGALQSSFESYRRACFDVLNEYFGVLVLVQPGIPLSDSDTSAPGNLPHMDHINTLIRGMTMESGVTTKMGYIPQHVTDLNARVNSLHRAITLSLEGMGRRHIKPDQTLLFSNALH